MNRAPLDRESLDRELWISTTHINKGENLDESIQTNKANKRNEFWENLSQKNPRVSLILTFQQMLKIQYQDANGLQDLVLGQALS